MIKLKEFTAELAENAEKGYIK